MSETSTTSKPRHLPRRSGVGMRFPIKGSAAKQWRTRPAKRRSVAPETCGAVHPLRPGIVDHATGEQIADALVCTGWASTDPRTGARKIHAGKHRARILSGQVERWDGTERVPFFKGHGIASANDFNQRYECPCGYGIIAPLDDSEFMADVMDHEAEHVQAVSA